MVKCNHVFKDFSEYLYFTRSLSEKQKVIVFNSLSEEDKDILDNSYIEDGWSDVICRNEIDAFIDELKNKYNYDILSIKSKAMRNKSTYVPKAFWTILTDRLNKYRYDSVKFILEGIKAVPCKDNPNVVLIVSTVSYKPEID